MFAVPYPAKLSPDAVLAAARQLLETSGPAALTMRALAETLDVRPSSLYRHFENRETLLAELGEQAARTLDETLQAATRGKSPRPALVAAADAYLNYARQHPHLYALLLIPGPERTAQELAASAGKQLWNTLLALVGAVSGDPDDTAHTVALWTFLHGFSELERCGIFGASGPRGGLDAGLEALLNHMTLRA